MRSISIRIAFVFVAVLLTASCKDRELDLAQEIVLAEHAEATARRELVRLEGETPRTAELDKQIAAQREVVRSAEITARTLRIRSKQ